VAVQGYEAAIEQAFLAREDRFHARLITVP
jgi:hypothetical protein